MSTLPERPISMVIGALGGEGARIVGVGALELRQRPLAREESCEVCRAPMEYMRAMSRDGG